jgi:outer membrane protein assembly factor BamB
MRNWLPFLLISSFVVVFLPAPAAADDWPQWLGPQRDSIWRETEILTRFPKGGPKLLWRIPLGQGYSGPAVAAEYVYITDRQDPVLPKGEVPKDKKLVIERVLCLDARTGGIVWKHTYPCSYKIGYPSGPRTTPVVSGAKAYTLGAMGDLFCLEAKSGKVLWEKHFLKDFAVKQPVWGWSAHPVLEGNLLYCLVGGKGSGIVAFDKDSGQVRWQALTSEEIGYAPPALIEAGGVRQLIVWLSDSVSGLDPKTGQVFWKQRYPAEGDVTRPAVAIATPRFSNDWLLVSSFYEGSLMLKLGKDRSQVTVAWQSKKGKQGRATILDCVMSTPFLADGCIYGVTGLGALRCVDIDTGKERWETFQGVAGQKAFLGTTFLVRHQDRYFLFTDQGDLIIARLTPKAYEEIDRAHLIDPSQSPRGRDVVWCHPAFANRCVYVRNDKEMVCYSLQAGK